MRMHRIMFLSLVIVMAAITAGADVKVVQQHHQDGFSMMGQDQPASDENNVTWIGDGKLCMDQGSSSSIVNLATKKMIIVSHDTKSYNEIDLPIDLASMLPPGMGEQMMAMMKFDVTVTPSAETKKVGPWTANRYDLKMTSSMMNMESVLWASTETPVDYGNYHELYSSVMSLQPGMDSMMAEMKKIDGYVVDQKATVTMKMMGETTIASSDTVISIEEMDAPAGTFEAPVGYERKEFDYMEMMQKQ